MHMYDTKEENDPSEECSLNCQVPQTPSAFLFLQSPRKRLSVSPRLYIANDINRILNKRHAKFGCEEILHIRVHKEEVIILQLPVHHSTKYMYMDNFPQSFYSDWHMYCYTYTKRCAYDLLSQPAGNG